MNIIAKMDKDHNRKRSNRVKKLMDSVAVDNSSGRTGYLDNVIKSCVFLPIAWLRIMWETNSPKLRLLAEKSKRTMGKTEYLSQLRSLFRRFGEEGLLVDSETRNSIIVEILPLLDDFLQSGDDLTALETAQILFEQALLTPTLIPLIAFFCYLLHQFYLEPDHLNPNGSAIISNLLCLCRVEFEQTINNSINMNNVLLIAEVIYFCNRLPLVTLEASAVVSHLVSALAEGADAGDELAVRGLCELLKILLQNDHHPSLINEHVSIFAPPRVLEIDALRISLRTLRIAQHRRWPSGQSIQRLIIENRHRVWIHYFKEGRLFDG